MTLTIAGGDKRALTVADLFASRGCKCYVFGFDKHRLGANGVEHTDDVQAAILNSSAVILPYPCQKDGFLNTPFSTRRTEIESILTLAGEDTLVLGGGLPKKSKNLIDYSNEEDFLLKNAVPTAEGALALAMQMLRSTVFGAYFVVMGYGRIGAYLAKILGSLGGKVTIVARNAKSRTLAEISGFDAVGFDDCEAPLTRADMVFNTVPEKIFGERELSAIRSGRTIIDLASLPGGADEEECRMHKILLVRALGLPGKVAPETAGKAVFETVLRLLFDRGIRL